MKFQKIVIIIVMSLLPLTISAKESAYRKCVKENMTDWTNNSKCDDFNNLNLTRFRALRVCALKLLDEVRSKAGTPQFTEEIDNLKRGAQGDIEELAQKKARACRVSLEINGNTIRIQSSGNVQ